MYIFIKVSSFKVTVKNIHINLVKKVNELADKKSKNKKPDLLDKVVSKLLITLDPDLVTDDNITSKTNDYKAIINRELELSRGVSGGNIIEFSRSLNDYNKKEKAAFNMDATDDLGDYIQKNAGNIYQYYNQKYRNKFVEAQDLQFISKFIPSLGQAVELCATHIVSSDDLSGSVNRNLSFGTALDEKEISQVTKGIEQFEKENKFLYKFKNIIVRESLVTGSYYVYAPSYQKLFTDYAKTLEKRKKMGGTGVAMQTSDNNIGTLNTVNESLSYASESIALESTEVEAIIKSIPDDAFESNDLNYKLNRKQYISDNIATVECIESAIPMEILDDVPNIAEALGATTHLKEIFDTKVMPGMEASKSGVGASDGTHDINKPTQSKFNISGTYIKFISPKNLLKIKILDEVVGYFYIDSKKMPKNKSGVTFTNNEWSNISRQSSIEKVANMLSEKVAKQFSTKFVHEHIGFKKLIADCIMANGVINTQYRIQFIPKEDIFEFKIRENSEGDGTSILSNALWPAKILAAIRIRKTLNYVNKSGDKMIAYTKKGIADASGRNQAQRVLRNLQEMNITFGDIIGDSSLMFHKYAADQNIMMPTSRSGNKLVEFEKMDGQTVDMSTDYEKELENQALVSTGVPPLLIQQVNEADFSKAFTTAHVGFAGMVAALQSDYEEPTTALYKRIIENLDIPDNLKTRCISTFNFKLPRPKALSVTNINEMIDNASRFAEAYTNLKIGEVDDNNKDVVQQIRYEIVKDRVSFIDWSKYDKLVDDINVEKKPLVDQNQQQDDQGGGEMDEEM